MGLVGVLLVYWALKNRRSLSDHIPFRSHTIRVLCALETVMWCWIGGMDITYHTAIALHVLSEAGVPGAMDASIESRI